MEYWQKIEVKATHDVCKIMGAGIEMVIASASAQITEHPRTDISRNLQDFIDGLVDLKVKTFDVAMAKAQCLEKDEDYAAYMAECRGILEAAKV